MAASGGAAAKCTSGKEAKGCKITVGGFLGIKSGVVVITQKGAAPIAGRVPAKLICGTAGEGTDVTITGSSAAVVGKTVSVKASGATTNSTAVTGTVTGTFSVTFTSAKKATFRGKGSVALNDGTTCSGTVKKTVLTRSVGG